MHFRMQTNPILLMSLFCTEDPKDMLVLGSFFCGAFVYEQFTSINLGKASDVIDVSISDVISLYQATLVFKLSTTNPERSTYLLRWYC